MRIWVTFLCCYLLAACADPVHDRSLAGLDLNDMEVLQSLNQELPQDERGLLATYVIAHWPESDAFCGEVLVDQNGTAPTTIGEAISLTRMREAERERRLVEAQRPQTSMEILIDRRDFLIGQQDRLFSRKEALFDRLGPEARTHPQWQAIEKELETSFAETMKLNTDIEGKRAKATALTTR